jgi:hypothetical protein
MYALHDKKLDALLGGLGAESRKRTISYVDLANDEKPNLQWARIYLEQPL